MKFRTLGMLLIMVVMAVFLIINWTTLSQETTVNLVYTEIQAPLGVLVVCGFCAIVVLLGVYTIWQQASMFSRFALPTRKRVVHTRRLKKLTRTA